MSLEERRESHTPLVLGGVLAAILHHQPSRLPGLRSEPHPGWCLLIGWPTFYGCTMWLCSYGEGFLFTIPYLQRLIRESTTHHFIYLFLIIKKYLLYFNWRLITLQYCGGFCHTLTWISHECARAPSSITPILSSSPPHPSGLSQSTGFKCSASCI